MKNCILSVKDVKKILIYQHPKTPLNQEFVIVFSHCGSATVFDLENLSVNIIFCSISFYIEILFVCISIISGCQSME